MPTAQATSAAANGLPRSWVRDFVCERRKGCAYPAVRHRRFESVCDGTGFKAGWRGPVGCS